MIGVLWGGVSINEELLVDKLSACIQLINEMYLIKFK